MQGSFNDYPSNEFPSDDRAEVGADGLEASHDASHDEEHDAGHAAALCVGFDAVAIARVANLLNSGGISCEQASSIDAAIAHLVSGATDLIIVTDRVTPATFAPIAAQARRINSSIKVLVAGAAPRGPRLLEAVRAGAIDWLDLSREDADLQNRLHAALELGREDRRRDARISRLKGICRKLSITRSEFSKQIDSLSEGLSDFRDRVDEAGIVGEFRGLISQELDVEDLLRTSMQYMLTKTGATNAAVFLPARSLRSLAWARMSTTTARAPPPNRCFRAWPTKSVRAWPRARTSFASPTPLSLSSRSASKPRCSTTANWLPGPPSMATSAWACSFSFEIATSRSRTSSRV